MTCQRSGSTEAHSFLFLLPPAFRTVFLSHRYCNKNKQTPCIVSRPAVTDSEKRRVIFHSVPQSCCMHIHIHIYIYAIIASRFQSVPGSGTRVVITNSLKMILFLQKRFIRLCICTISKTFAKQMLKTPKETLSDLFFNSL